MKALSTTDNFILRCERIRAESYRRRAAAQSALGESPEPAGWARFGESVAWFAGRRARVHWLDESGPETIDSIEAWFQQHALDATFDVAPTLANRAICAVLGQRGYRLASWQPVTWRDGRAPLPSLASDVEVEDLGTAENADFCQTMLRGYGFREDELEMWLPVQQAKWRGESARYFLARLRGQPIAAATLVFMDGAARLANAATLPEFRQRGAQAALIQARLLAAAEAQAEFVVADARQGGSSLRNLARAGFATCAQITQWRREPMTLAEP